MIYDALFPGQVQVEKDPWIRFKRKHQIHGHLTLVHVKTVNLYWNKWDWLRFSCAKQQATGSPIGIFGMFGLERHQLMGWYTEPLFFARRTFPPRASLAAVIATVKVWDSAGACTYSLEAKLLNRIDLAARRVRDAGRSSSYRLFEDWSFSISLSLYIFIWSYIRIYIDAYTIMLQLAVLLQHSMLRFRDGGEGRSGREIRRSRRAAPSRADSWPWKARKRARSSNAGGWGLGVEDFETEFKGDSQMPKYRNIKGKGKGDLWSIFSNLRTVTILLMNI